MIILRQNSAYFLLAYYAYNWQVPMQPLQAEQFNALCTAHGFAAGYCLPLLPLGEIWASQYQKRPPHTDGLCLDPRAAYPEATCIVLFVKAYAPLLDVELPGYYIASNAGYHAANALCRALQASGFFAARLEVPLPALISAFSLGTLTRSGLLDIPPFGTRTALFTIVTNAFAAAPQTPHACTPCGACSACAGACPAIHPVHGLNASLCIRTYMENAPMPHWVMKNMQSLLGCERCQRVCPRNAHIGLREASPKETYAFDLLRLIKGETAQARALVGKNMCTGRRLSAHAAILAAHAGRLDALPAIDALVDGPSPLAKRAAQYARVHLSGMRL